MVDYKKVNIEMWKYIYINGEKTKYMVSTQGRIKNTKRGNYLSTNTFDKDGYVQICLSHKNIKYVLRRCRLVAIAFIPNPLNKPEVNHLDRNVANDDVKNLEWCTPKENTAHAILTGRPVVRGINHGNVIYTEEQIHSVCKLIEANKHTVRQISELTNVNISTIRDLIYNKAWTHISSKYDLTKYNCYGKEIYSKEIISLMYYYINKGYRNIDIIRVLGLPETKKVDARVRYYRKKFNNQDCSTTIENDDYYNIIIK